MQFGLVIYLTQEVGSYSYIDGLFTLLNYGWFFMNNYGAIGINSPSVFDLSVKAFHCVSFHVHCFINHIVNYFSSSLFSKLSSWNFLFLMHIYDLSLLVPYHK